MEYILGLRPFTDPFNRKNRKKYIVGIMVHNITFRPHSRPVDDTSLYTLIYKCIHFGISHRMKTKSKYNVA